MGPENVPRERQGCWAGDRTPRTTALKHTTELPDLYGLAAEKFSQTLKEGWYPYRLLSRCVTGISSRDSVALQRACADCVPKCEEFHAGLRPAHHALDSQRVSVAE